MVHEYKVTVTRISNALTEIRIVSPIELTEADVKSVAIEKAANHVFSEKDAEYEVQHIDTSKGKLKQ